MSIQSKLVGSCDALLLALVAIMQTGLLVAAAGAWGGRESAASSAGEQRYVEVIVVAAPKMSQG